MICRRCLKPPPTCYCARIRAVRPEATVVILQHPREYRNRIGTGRMAHLCLEGSRLIVGAGADFDRSRELLALLEDPGRFCAVVYPGPESLDLTTAHAEELAAWAPPGRRLTLLLIDGTWATARKMLRQSARLRALPRICFTPATPSEYAVRRQPAGYCWSTIEAVHYVLAKLDPSVDPGILLEVFRSMVTQQAAFGPPLTSRTAAGCRSAPPSRASSGKPGASRA